MKATVIDTLRYANRLKGAGVEIGQAEAMSRALNDELTEGLVTKTDLDNAVSATKADLGNAVSQTKADLDIAVSELSARIDALDAKFEVRLAAMEGKFEIRLADMEGKLEVRFGAMEGRFGAIEGRFGAMDGNFASIDSRFASMDTKFDALRSQNRYVFLVLALIAGLGFYNATAPHLLGKIGHAPSAEPIRSVPAVQAPNAGADAATELGARPIG